MSTETSPFDGGPPAEAPRLEPGAESHMGAALAAGATRGWGFLAEIAGRKLLMNLRILTSPYVLIALGAIAGFTIFNATLRRTGCCCSAMNTTPNPPSPICSSSLYGPTDVPGPSPIDG